MGDPAAMERLLTSYRLMLEFYGQVLVSDKTGQIARTDVLAPAPGSWRVRYANLLSHSHNFLRQAFGFGYRDWKGIADVSLVAVSRGSSSATRSLVAST